MPKIIDARVDWMLQFGNNPQLYLLVDKIPEISEMVFRRKDSLWLGEKDGYFLYYSYNPPGNNGGLGGAVVKVTMEDGSVEELKGPWIGCAGPTGDKFGKRIIECSITDRRKVWEEGHTFMSAAYSVDDVLDAFVDLGIRENVTIKAGAYTNNPTWKGRYQNEWDIPAGKKPQQIMDETWYLPAAERYLNGLRSEIEKQQRFIDAYKKKQPLGRRINGTES